MSLHNFKVMWSFITKVILLGLWSMKCIKSARIILKYGLLAAGVTPSIMVTVHTGQGPCSSVTRTIEILH